MTDHALKQAQYIIDAHAKGVSIDFDLVQANKLTSTDALARLNLATSQDMLSWHQGYEYQGIALAADFSTAPLWIRDYKGEAESAQVAIPIHNAEDLVSAVEELNAQRGPFDAISLEAVSHDVSRTLFAKECGIMPFQGRDLHAQAAKPEAPVTRAGVVMAFAEGVEGTQNVAIAIEYSSGFIGIATLPADVTLVEDTRITLDVRGDGIAAIHSETEKTLQLDEYDAEEREAE